MAQQVINIGSADNDGTGDPLRTAFSKTNANFTELYTSTPATYGWDPNNSHPEFTLTNNNLTATKSTSAATGLSIEYRTAVSYIPVVSGKVHAEIVLAGLHTGNTLDVVVGGITNNQINALAEGTTLGEQSTDIGVYNASVSTNPAVIYKGGVNVGTVPGHVLLNGRLIVEIDHPNGVMKVAIDNGAYSSNIALPPGDLFLGCSAFHINEAWTLKLKAADFIRTPSTGFVAWDLT